LNLTIKSLQGEINELESLTDSLSDKLEALKDVKTQLSGARAVANEITEEREKLKGELDTASGFKMDLE